VSKYRGVRPPAVFDYKQALALRPDDTDLQAQLAAAERKAHTASTEAPADAAAAGGQQ
jgi:hypothetical protein